jgi:exonuclease III
MCGLNAPSKHKMMKKRITREKVEIVLIQETKCDRETMGKIAKKIWKGCEVEAVDSNGASRGLAILWDPMKWKLDLFVLSPRILTMSFKGLGSQSHDYIMNAYGPHLPPLKREFLEALNHLGNTLSGQHWVVGGDFNMITTLWEKKGGARRMEGESDSFRDWINNNRLVDIHTNNGPFTWTNKRRLEKSIAVRLDRFLTSESIF